MIKVKAITNCMCSKCKKEIKIGDLYWYGSKIFCLNCGKKLNPKRKGVKWQQTQ